MDKLWAMKVFVQVVEAKNFTQAAVALQLSVGQISRTIQALERHLEGTLLKRTTRHVAVTELGAAYYARCRDVLEEVDAIEADLGASLSGYKGRIRVSMPALIAKQTIIPHLNAFYADYPDIEIQLVINDFQGDLAAQGLDCALHIGDVRSAGLVARPLRTYKRMTCASPDYLEQMGVPQTLEELSSHRGVGYVTNAGRVREWDFDLNGRVLNLKFKSWVLANDADTYIACGLAGLGLIQSSDVLLEAHLRRGHLHEILTGFPCTPGRLSIVYPSDRNRSKRLRIFLDWLAALYAGST